MRNSRRGQQNSERSPHTERFSWPWRTSRHPGLRAVASSQWNSPQHLSADKYLPEHKMKLITPFPWKVGQHLSIVGGTGTGKSTLASYLLTQRKYVIVLKSKPDEVTYDMPTKRTANSIESVDRMVLSPTGNQRSHFAYAYDRVWRQGGWTIYVDELFYHTEKLHLGTAVDNLLTQGRSKHISVMIGM